MKGKRYSQEQKVYALKQVEAGTQVVEVCRQLDVVWIWFGFRRMFLEFDYVF
jgi:Transposase